GAQRELTSTVAGTSNTVTTHVGAAPTAASLRRFLVGPKGAEITGIAAAPDLRTLFVNIQHPGESGDLVTLQSSWPALDGSSRPRAASLVITKHAGGTIGGSLVRGARPGRAPLRGGCRRTSLRPAEHPDGPAD